MKGQDSFDDNELIEAYFRNALTDSKDDLWAWREVDELVTDNPEKAWKIILGLLERASSKLALRHVAAGPLEDLTRRHGEKYVERLVEEAKHNTRLQYALGHIYLRDENQPTSSKIRELLDYYDVRTTDPLPDMD